MGNDENKNEINREEEIEQVNGGLAINLLTQESEQGDFERVSPQSNPQPTTYGTIIR